MPGKENQKRKPLKVLYVDGSFTEDRSIWKEKYKGVLKKYTKAWKKRSRYRKAESRSTGQMETFFLRRKGINYCRFGTSGKSQDGGRESQWTRGLHRDGGDNTAPTGKKYKLQDEDRFVGQEEAPGSWKSVILVFFRKPDAELQKKKSRV